MPFKKSKVGEIIAWWKTLYLAFTWKADHLQVRTSLGFVSIGLVFWERAMYISRIAGLAHFHHDGGLGVLKHTSSLWEKEAGTAWIPFCAASLLFHSRSLGMSGFGSFGGKVQDYPEIVRYQWLRKQIDSSTSSCEIMATSVFYLNAGHMMTLCSSKS